MVDSHWFSNLMELGGAAGGTAYLGGGGSVKI